MSSARRKQLDAKAATTGTGAGTLLLYFADHLAPGHQWLKPILVYSAPLCSMVSAALWLFAARTLAHFAELLKVRMFLSGKRKVRDRACADPNNSQQHKDAMCRLYERYEQAAMTFTHAQLKELEITLEV